MHNITR